MKRSEDERDVAHDGDTEEAVALVRALAAYCADLDLRRWREAQRAAAGEMSEAAGDGNLPSPRPRSPPT